MTTNTSARARLLIEQKRYKEAEKELQQNLSSDPNNTETLSLLSVCKCEEKKYEESEKLIKIAISLEPANPFLIYVFAKILFDQDKYTEAKKYIKEAIRLDVYEADYFGLLANIYLQEKEWDKSLEFSNKGLEISPDNITCLNIRSTSLLKLNKKEDSYNTIQDALYYEPDNAYTHANLGWGLLEKGEHKKALEHFRQALKIDPESDEAKMGMVQALKAKYWIYRIFLKYSFWIGNMKSGAQWGLIIGFFIGSRVLNSLANSNPGLKPFVTPLIFLYILFAISTWIVGPISNLFLRLNVYGRYALTKLETISSNFVGASLAVGLTSFIVYLFNPQELFFALGVIGVSMMIPFSSMLVPEVSKKRRMLIAYTTGLGIVGLLELFYIFANDPIAQTFGTIYLVGIIAYQFVANAILIR